jgi:hypothetical protein
VTPTAFDEFGVSVDHTRSRGDLRKSLDILTATPALGIGCTIHPCQDSRWQLVQRVGVPIGEASNKASCYISIFWQSSGGLFAATPDPAAYC